MAIESMRTEYDAHRTLLATESFDGPAAGVLGLRKVLGEDGPERTHVAALEHLRTVTLKFKEAERIMECAGLDPAATTTPAETGVRKAATLKFLRHLYLVGERGSQQVWVLSTPKKYTHYPLDELLTVKASHASIRDRLADVDEQFGTETRSRLCEAMALGLAWCEAAKFVLSSAKSDAAAMDKVKRWFAEGTTSVADLEKTIAALSAGFKKIAGSLNGNLVVITDMPSLRSDPKFEMTEAFMLSTGGKSQMPRTIYIEKALFENYDISVLHDMKKNWARVLVHECTHIDARTADKRYAYRGLRPGTGLGAADAAINADSWAFFAADCGGALTDGDRLRALDGTGGKLDKLAKNWN